MPIVNVPKEGEDLNTFSEKAFRASIANYISAISAAGTTAARPTTFLWVGRTYYDTSLNRPIWLRDLNPPVWIRADGVVV